MSLEIHGLDLRLAKKMLFTGVNLRIDKPNLVVYVIDEAGLFIEGADVNILSSGHNLNSVTDALGTVLTRFMPAINNTLTVSKDGYATSTQIIYNETPSTLSVYVQLFASEIRLKVVDRNHEPIEGATCRVLNASFGRINFLRFDRIDDSVLWTNDASVKNRNVLTLEMWFKKTGTGGIRRLWDESIASSQTSNRFSLLSSVNDDKLRAQGRANDGDSNTVWCQSATVLTSDQWYHVAFVYDAPNNFARIYLDGEINVTNNSLANKTFTNSNPAAPPRLAARTGGADYFGGDVADVRMWSTARTQEQIQDNMNKRLVGDEAGLIEYWKIDEATGAVVNGLVNSYDGAILGATWVEADESFPLFDNSIQGYDPTPYDSQTTNANGLTTLNYQIDTVHGLEVTLPGKRRFIMPFERTTRGLLDWQVMLSDYLATFATDKGNILINSEPENNDANFLIE